MSQNPPLRYALLLSGNKYFSSKIRLKKRIRSLRLLCCAVMSMRIVSHARQTNQSRPIQQSVIPEIDFLQYLQLLVHMCLVDFGPYGEKAQEPMLVGMAMVTVTLLQSPTHSFKP